MSGREGSFGSELRPLWHLEDGGRFLNHGSFGACPKPVFERYQEWQLELERQPVEFIGRRSHNLLLEARTALARYLNCDPDEVVYSPNVTTALNVVARSLPLEDGDEILTTDHEYGALDRTWRFMGAKNGSKVVRQTLPLPLDDPDEVVEAVMAAFCALRCAGEKAAPGNSLPSRCGPLPSRSASCGKATNSSSSMPGRCEPWPGYRKAT